MAVVRSADNTRQRYDVLTSIPGIAQISAIQLLGDLATLSHLSVKQRGDEA